MDLMARAAMSTRCHLVAYASASSGMQRTKGDMNGGGSDSWVLEFAISCQCSTAEQGGTCFDFDGPNEDANDVRTKTKLLRQVPPWATSSPTCGGQSDQGGHSGLFRGASPFALTKSHYGLQLARRVWMVAFTASDCIIRATERYTCSHTAPWPDRQAS